MPIAGRSVAFLCIVALLGGTRPAQAGINVWTSHGPEGGQVHALVIDPATPTTLYAGQAAGGVFMSADGGDTWGATNAGLTNTNVYALAIDPSTPTTLYAGTVGGGVFKSADGGATWDAANAGLDTTSIVWALAIDPATPATLYAGTSGDGVFKSTNGGNTWSAANTGLRVGLAAVVLTLAIDPMTPTTLYATVSRDGAGGVIESGVFKSSDGGGTWHATTTGQIDTSVWALAIDPVMPTTLYAVAEFGGGVFRSTDGAATWGAISAGPTEGKVFALVVDSAEPSTLYAGAGGAGVFTSTDGGSTWSALNAGLTNGNVFALAIDPVMSSHLYAGTAGGVFDIEQVARGDGGGCAVAPAHRSAAWWLLVAVLVLAWVRRPPRPMIRWPALTFVAAGMLGVQLAASPAHAGCVGDCNGDRAVGISELITGVNMALGMQPISTCASFDCQGTGGVPINCLIQGVNNALGRCPAEDTPTATATPTEPAATPTATPTATNGPSRCEQQHEAVQAAIDRWRHSPNAIAAVRNEACGVSLYASGDPAHATTESLFLLGSVTKTFVATSVLSLVEEGKLGLDDPINNWITGLDPKYDPVTVRMLLKHTSGIFNYTDDPILYADKNRAWAPRELVDLALARDPYFAPGAGFHYCNTNYVLLGMILERVTGQKLGSVLHQHAIDRAGLQHTFFIPEDPIEGQMATPFYPSGQEITDPFDPSVYWAIGSMASSAADLIEWVWALYRAQTVLDPTQVREMIDDSVVAELLPDFAESRYGLGVIIGTFTGTNSGPGVGHSGRWDGTSTDAYYFNDIETAVVVLQNVQFWPPKFGDEAVLIAILNTLSEMRISRQDVAADSQYGREDSISSDSGFPRGGLRWARRTRRAAPRGGSRKVVGEGLRRCDPYLT